MFEADLQTLDVIVVLMKPPGASPMSESKSTNLKVAHFRHFGISLKWREEKGKLRISLQIISTFCPAMKLQQPFYFRCPLFMVGHLEGNAVSFVVIIVSILQLLVDVVNEDVVAMDGRLALPVGILDLGGGLD